MDVHDLDLLWARTLHMRAPARNDPLGTRIVPTTMYHLPGDPAGAHQYGRWSNPTWDALESALSSLESAEAVIFPSGMAAVAAVFFSTLRAGDRVLLPADGYYTTRALAEKFLAPLAVQVESCATAELGGADLSGYRLVWIESPSNPMLELADIAAVARRAHAAGALVAVDNTNASPLGQRPLALGADLVVVADTKRVGGHSDVLLGHVATAPPGL